MRKLIDVLTDMIRDCVYIPCTTVCITSEADGVVSLWRCSPDKLRFNGEEWGHVDQDESRRAWIKNYYSHENIEDYATAIYSVEYQEYA